MVSAIQNVLVLVTGLLSAGFPWALAKRLAETHGDPEAAKPEFRTALVANFGFGLLLGVAFLAAQMSGLQLVPTHSLVIDLFIAVEMPLLAVDNTFGGAAMALLPPNSDMPETFLTSASGFRIRPDRCISGPR